MNPEQPAGARVTSGDAELARLARRLKRERSARLEAEQIAERATRELYESVQRLREVNEALELARDSEAAAYEQLASLDQLKSDFVSMMSHELRTPIGSIMALASLMSARWSDIDDADCERYLGTIATQATRLSRLVESLLRMTSFASGDWKPDPSVVDLAELCAEAGAVVPDPDLELRCARATLAYADREHLTLILSDLVANAVSFGRPPIVIGADSIDDELVKLYVIDHGDGVPEEFQARMFDPFEQASSGDQRHPGGAGLGLAIVSQLVLANAGDISYERHGNACGFVVRLPAPAYDAP